MVTQEFIKHFLTDLTVILKENNLDKFAKTCEHALREASSNHKNVSTDSYSEISKEFFAKMAVLVANKDKRHLAAKVHWISETAASFAESVLHATYAKYVKPKAAMLTSFGNSVAKNTSHSNVSIGAGNVSNSVASINSTNSDKKSDQEQKLLNDTTVFKDGDYNYEGYSEEDKSNLSFAENCCGFPKLALYLYKNHSIDMRNAVIAVNKSCKNGTLDSLTPSVVLETYKENKVTIAR